MEEFDNDFEETFEEKKPYSLVTVGILLAAIVVIIVLCVLLWVFTHAGEDGVSNVTQQSDSEVLNPSENAEMESNEEEPSVDLSMEDPSVEENPSADELIESSVEESGVENTEEVTEEQEPSFVGEGMLFLEVSESVTAKDVTNLRSNPSTADSENIVAQLKNGETITRTGLNRDTGWSCLEYNGQIVYAVSQYLTTDLSYVPPVVPSDPNRITTLDGRVIIFEDIDDYVTPKLYVNLRTEPSTSQGQATAKCQITSDTAVHRTGHSADSGWSRVEYNGEILYVVSSMVVSAEAPQ